MLHFRINKYLKFGQFHRAAKIKWSVRLDKNHFFYFHPSKRDCSRLKGACQQRADTGKPSKGSSFVYWCCCGVGKALSTRNNPVSMDENRNNVLFLQSMLNRSSDPSGRIKLAKFWLFIYSNLDPKINNIYRNLYLWKAQGLRISKICLF